MTPEELAKSELEKLRKNSKLTFPIDPFKILRNAGIYIVLKDFENLECILMQKLKRILAVCFLLFILDWQKISRNDIICIA